MVPTCTHEWHLFTKVLFWKGDGINEGDVVLEGSEIETQKQWMGRVCPIWI